MQMISIQCVHNCCGWKLYYRWHCTSPHTIFLCGMLAEIIIEKCIMIMTIDTVHSDTTDVVDSTYQLTHSYMLPWAGYTHCRFSNSFTLRWFPCNQLVLWLVSDHDTHCVAYSNNLCGHEQLQISKHGNLHVFQPAQVSEMANYYNVIMAS